ncbi:Mic19p [Sporobolomyces koalae]|uniref:Mic19p n=1 Tax=Sporobolomyces koalae TaxID=500713 RepID=UPI00316ECBB9
MGSGTSRPEQEINSKADQTFFANRDSPVQFSETLINQLSTESSSTNASSTTGVPSSRQEALDHHIQLKIQSELKHLREQEHQVRQEIERALEKENLDREKGAASANEPGLAHSASLLEDLKQLEQRTASIKQSRQETSEWKHLESNKEQLASCFQKNRKTPLECRAEAESFKQAVAQLEKTFIASVN